MFNPFILAMFKIYHIVEYFVSNIKGLFDFLCMFNHYLNPCHPFDINVD